MYEVIGKIKNDINKKMDPFEMRKYKSEIIIYEKYSEGLFRIEENDYLNILFEFDKSKDCTLKSSTYDGEVRGVFSSRSPCRPNKIGITTVKLLKREGNILLVKGLDALNDSPVIDIKPYVASFDDYKIKRTTLNSDKNSPRKDIIRMIKNEEIETLLLEAGRLHGHFCPGLALGVISSAYAMKRISVSNDGMEKVLAITETNNCMSDGIQYVTGCTFGNNALVFKDFGKNAFTLTKRDGKGLRVKVRNDYRDRISSEDQEFFELFDKVVKKRLGTEDEEARFKLLSQKAAFNLIKLSFDDIFLVENVSVEIPGYAPIHDSIICKNCLENTMQTRIKAGFCLNCYNKGYMELNGLGISKK
jgi:tRNA-Thr(GGU) m(6)t(6)A37 methyltransferase TsaA